MQTGKQILIDIIKPALNIVDTSDKDLKEITYLTAELKTFLINFEKPEDIINLSTEALNEVTKVLTPKEAKEKFMAEIKFIKGLAQMSFDKKEKLSLDKNQLLTLNELKELIEKNISTNEYTVSVMNKTNEKQIQDYRDVKATIEKQEIFTSKDYDIIEEIITRETPNDISNNLDKIYSYINESNSRKLQDIYTGIKEEEKPIINITLTPIVKEEPEEEIIVLEREIEDPEEKLDYLELGSLNFEAFESEEKNDFFSFVNLKDERKETSNNQNQIKEIISYLKFNPENIEEEYLNKLKLKDLNELKELAKYLKEENKIVYSKIKKENIYALLYILANSSKKIIERNLKALNDYFGIKSAGGQLFKIVNTATPIFSERGSENFLINAQTFSEHKVSMDKIIENNINILHSDHKNIENNLKIAKKYGANPKELIENVSQSLSNKTKFASTESKIRQNIDILKMYGFDLKSLFQEEQTVLTILNSSNLASKIDQLIEVGLNENIHKDPTKTGMTLKSYIVKRIYYAFKNNIPIWEDINTEYRRINQSRENKISFHSFKNLKKHIEEGRKLINEPEIIIIKSDYPIMEIIDESSRPAIYSNSPISTIKRQTELIFDTQIISRPKVFRVFKRLVADNIPEKEALLFSITHNSILEEREFDYINNMVNTLGDEELNVELFKTI